MGITQIGRLGPVNCDTASELLGGGGSFSNGFV